MLKLGIIGTSSISHHFLEAAHTSGKFQLSAVYSRKIETAEKFVEQYQGVKLFDQLNDFFNDSFEVVYIASPNSLHYSQAKMALSAGKHVILEKPAVTQPHEWQDLVQTAKEHQCFIFEAARNYHEDAFATIKYFLADKHILGADFNYAKYSSKMPDLLAGQTPNVFSDRFAGGALMDLGIYPIYAAVRLFGKPLGTTYQAQKLDNSVDLNGDGMLYYPDYQVHIKAGKNITSNLPCEIYTTDGTLTLNTIEHVQSAIFTDHQGNEVQLPIQQAPHTMTEEVAAFANMIKQPDQALYQSWIDDATHVHNLLYTMRQNAGIRFEAEKMKTKLPTEWQELIDQLGFQEFTPIQTQLFDSILDGETLLGVSPTGTGKTLAYLLPSLLKLQKKKAQQLLILAPNTELAGQIFDVTKTWGEAIGLTAQLFLSGSSQKRQIERLKKGPEILIGTPGRIFELIKLKKIKMMNVETIILDEFDQLLDDSQIHFVEKITNYAPRDHQLIYMSATTKFDQDKIAANTRTIDLSDQKLDNIQHFYMQVDQRHRVDMLRKLAHVDDFRGLVFFNSLSDLGSAEEKLQYRDILAVSLASDVNVKFRKVILEKFKDNQLTLLLATDLLARGIDIDSLECVVNFDVPRDIETYTHRAGRTGRMGKEGYVITLVTHPEDLKKLKKFASVREIVLKNQELYIK